MKRRQLLKTAGGLVVGFTLRNAFPLLAQEPAAGVPPRTLDPREVDSALAIHADGSVTVFTSKVDVGTGMRIAIAQMAAEELGVATNRVTVVDGDTSTCPNTGGTGGSTGLTRGGTAVRQAAATARQEILKLAAERLGVPVDQLTIIDGVVRPSTVLNAGPSTTLGAGPSTVLRAGPSTVLRAGPSTVLRAGGAASGRGVGIGALVNDRRLSVPVDPKAPLVAPANYARVRQSPARPDVPAKCTGRHVYVQDFSVNGMLHARVIRPPAIGATLSSVDASSIRHLPNVRVVRLKDFLAVVAPDEWAAVRASRELSASWSEWRGLPRYEDLERYVREGAIEREQTLVDRGPAGALPPSDVGAGAIDAAISRAHTRLSATYFWPCQSHASLGPSSAVADIKGDGGTIWTSSQVIYGLRNTIARLFELAPEKLRVVFVEGSGSYGTNGADHAAADAVLISKTIQQPVRVQWSRQDELAWDPKGPQQLLELRAGVNESGDIAAWDTQMWIPVNRRGARILLAAGAAGIPQDNGRDAAGIFENGEPPYAVDHVRVHVHWLRDTPLNPSNLRAPGKPANIFAVEGFTDEIAASLKIDALDFRASRLRDPRALAVLDRASTAFGWTSRPSPNPAASGEWLAGRGLAYVRYKMAENYIATFVEVAVQRATGRIEVKRVVCAHDCGLVVNPDALRHQIEGGIVQGLSRALHEEVQFDESRVTSVDWRGYPILRFSEVPAIEVILIERPEEAMWGGGEASTVPVAAALANAFFDATGIRLRRAPFTAERVKRALAGKPAPA
jgi:CO/xanthine dehydrogenase Mo-binding subunit